MNKRQTQVGERERDMKERETWKYIKEDQVKNSKRETEIERQVEETERRKGNNGREEERAREKVCPRKHTR